MCQAQHLQDTVSASYTSGLQAGDPMHSTSDNPCGLTTADNRTELEKNILLRRGCGCVRCGALNNIANTPLAKIL